MEIQYSEGIPRVVIDQEKGRMYFDTTGDTSADLAEFYEKYCADDLEAFSITPEFSKGIYAMEAALKAAGSKRPFVKVQTTGPLSVGLSIVDEVKRAIYYNAEFVDVVVKAMAMKCRWQIRKFQALRRERHLLHRRADSVGLRLLHLRQRYPRRYGRQAGRSGRGGPWRRRAWPEFTAAAIPSGPS